MASRQEEKEARRQARLDAEADAARTAARQRRVQLVAAGLAAAVIVVGVAVLVIGGSGGDGDPKTDPQASVTLPAAKTTDVNEAAKLAGCTLASPRIEGRGHEQRDFTEADYKTNPPTSGTHYPEWAQDGVYGPENTPQLGLLVHTLEHGRIDVQYKPGTPQKTVDALESFVAEQPYHMVMFENQTKMDAQVAATAWGKSLTCPSVNDATWDALRTFRDENLDKGPERIP